MHDRRAAWTLNILTSLWREPSDPASNLHPRRRIDEIYDGHMDRHSRVADPNVDPDPTFHFDGSETLTRILNSFQN